MTKMPVNQIIPFSTVDGPNSHTSIFLQKCNIVHGYCHSPETQNPCNNRGAYVPQCPEDVLSMVDGVVVWDKSKCVSCNTCIEVCPYRASPKIRRMDIPAVMKEVEKNIPFIRGITVSGGECGLYPQFLQELSTLVRAKGPTCLLDSGGTMCLSKYPELIKVCDGVVLDVKAWSPGVFRTFTGGDNATVKENLLLPSSCGKLEEVRVVSVEGHVNAEDAIHGTVESLGPLTGNTRLSLTSFRNNGVKDLFAVFSSPSAERMKQLAELVASIGFRNIIIKQRQAVVLRQFQNQCASAQITRFKE